LTLCAWLLVFMRLTGDDQCDQHAASVYRHSQRLQAQYSSAEIIQRHANCIQWHGERLRLTLRARVSKHLFNLSRKHYWTYEIHFLPQVLHPGEVNALVHSYRISVDRSAAPSAITQRLRLRVEISYIAEGQTAQSLHRATPTHLPPKVSCSQHVAVACASFCCRCWKSCSRDASERNISRFLKSLRSRFRYPSCKSLRSSTL
jgi:hypothetical protein